MKIIRKTVAVFKYGQMDPGMMDFGETGWQMDMEGSCMLKEMSMRVNGQKIRLMDMVFILILMEVDTKDNGTKISSTAMELNNGQMVPNTTDNISKV